MAISAREYYYLKCAPEENGRNYQLTCPRLPYQSKFQKSGTARLTDPCTCIGFTVLL